MTKSRPELALGTALAGLAAAVATALAVSVTASAAAVKLIGTVGPGDTITLKTASGKRVTSLPRGTYTLTVRDRSEDHNFVLRGPGVRKAVTGVEFVGTRTVTVRFRAGVVTFVCAPHADDMRGGFKVR